MITDLLPICQCLKINLDARLSICYYLLMIRQGQTGKDSRINISAASALSLAGSSGGRSISGKGNDMMKLNRVCAYCKLIMTKGDDGAETTHTICGKCLADMKSKETCRLTVLVKPEHVFSEIMSRECAASLLRVVRRAPTFVSYHMGAA